MCLLWAHTGTVGCIVLSLQPFHDDLHNKQKCWGDFKILLIILSWVSTHLHVSAHVVFLWCGGVPVYVQKASPCQHPPLSFGHPLQAPMGAYSGQYSIRSKQHPSLPLSTSSTCPFPWSLSMSSVSAFSHSCMPHCSKEIQHHFLPLQHLRLCGPDSADYSQCPAIQ